MAQKQITINAKSRKTKEGKPFMTFTCVQADGTRAGLKFRACVTNAPREEGRYIMVVDTTTMNRKITDYGVEWWVRENPISIEPAPKIDYAAEEF